MTSCCINAKQTMSYSSDEDEDKPPTAFAKQLYTLLDNDRQIVDRDSKYTAFWLAHGMTLSSQYRQVRPQYLHTLCVSQSRRTRDIGPSLESLQRLLLTTMAAAVQLLMHSQRHNSCTTLKTAMFKCLQSRSTRGLAAQV